MLLGALAALGLDRAPSTLSPYVTLGVLHHVPLALGLFCVLKAGEVAGLAASYWERPPGATGRARAALVPSGWW